MTLDELVNKIIPMPAHIQNCRYRRKDVEDRRAEAKRLVETYIALNLQPTQKLPSGGFCHGFVIVDDNGLPEYALSVGSKGVFVKDDVVFIEGLVSGLDVKENDQPGEK